MRGDKVETEPNLCEFGEQEEKSFQSRRCMIFFR